MLHAVTVENFQKLKPTTDHLEMPVFSFEYLLLFINKEKKSDYSIDQWNNGKQMKILVY